MFKQLQLFTSLLKGSFRDLIPIVIVILFFQLIILQTIPDNWQGTAIGLFIVGVGLAIFLQGLEVGVFPIGEKLASDFAKSGWHYWILGFGFLIGFGTTIAEPALLVIAQKAASISNGRIDANALRFVVAGSVGFAILVGVYRIIKGHPIHYYIITGYVLVVSITFVTPHEIVALSYDLGGVTTSTVTVPLVAALGIGLASNIKGRNPVIDGFGLIAFASLTPMIFVQIYGIYAFNFVEANAVSEIVVNSDVSAITQISFTAIVNGLLAISLDVLPILSIIFFFQYVILKKPLPIAQLRSVLGGFALVIVGLYAFVLGLEMGLFSLGETMAYELTRLNDPNTIYLFAFSIGFATTMAEPALMAIAKKSKEISDGKIDDFILRLFVALGVAFGIALGAYRIIQGDFIQYYIIGGYLVVIVLTYFAPKYIVPIAYDSGGVTTSTVTVPLVAALGIGLATNIDGRSPLMDGFGLIAFASLFPMITVMAYGIISDRLSFKGHKQLTQTPRVVDNLAFNNSSITFDENNNKILQHLSIRFSTVVAIVPIYEYETALDAAHEAGATGVTSFSASGMGLAKMNNMYRPTYASEATDRVLLFILPEQMVDKVISNISTKLRLTTTGEGLIFSTPIDQIHGISLKQQNTIKNTIKAL
jgi:nitrogen regulatory protein PII